MNGSRSCHSLRLNGHSPWALELDDAAHSAQLIYGLAEAVEVSRAIGGRHHDTLRIHSTRKPSIGPHIGRSAILFDSGD